MNNDQTPLESWKEIASYVQKDVTTVQRWEKREGLPVHRHSHNSRSSVYAYPSEIDAWRAGRKVATEMAPVRVFWRWPAFAATMLLCLVMVGNGVRPVSAQQTNKKITVRQVLSGTDVLEPYSISRDGRYVSFTDYTAQGALGIRDLVTGTTRRLTDFGTTNFKEFTLYSLISPDETQVAYTHLMNWGDERELCIVPFAGGQSKIIFSSEGTKDIAVRGWTPDGKQLLVERTLKDNTGQIAMLAIADGSYRVLRSFGWQGFASGPRLSPDGRFIAYDASASETVPAHDTFVLAVDGSKETKVVESPANEWDPMWSPDGSQLLFLSDRTGSGSLWSVLILQGQVKGPAQLIKPDMGFSNLLGMTQDGSLHYVSEGLGHRNVYTAELDAKFKATKAPKLASDRYVNISAGASYSPDGKSLAYYAANAPNDRMVGLTRLIIRTVATGEEREVRLPSLRIPPYGFLTPPKWFPDGRHVLALSWERRKPVFGFYRVDVISGETESIHQSRSVGFLGRYDLTPDGKTLFYLDAADSGTQPFLMRFELGTKQLSEFKNTGYIWFAISPDGKQLAYERMEDGRTTYDVAPVTGGEARRLYKSPVAAKNLAVTWSPGQQYLIFALPEEKEYPHSSLWEVPVTGGSAEKMGITSEGEILSAQVFGNQIAFTSSEPTAQALWALENFLPAAKGKR